MNWELAFLWYATFLISATVHEAAHALLAKLGGDPTAYHGGQVSLNPIPHVRREPFGMVLLPLISLYLNGGRWCFGFASTPIDAYWAHRHPRRAALMSAGGPLSNLLLAAIAFGVLWFVGRPDSGSTDAVRRIAGTFLFLNLLLFVFNLVPLPPLDGAGVAKGFGRGVRGAMEQLERLPYVAIVGFLAANALVPTVFLPMFRTISGWLPYPYRPW